MGHNDLEYVSRCQINQRSNQIYCYNLMLPKKYNFQLNDPTSKKHLIFGIR